MAELGFDITSKEVQEASPMGARSVLPAGTYSVEILDSERKESKSGKGAYLNVTFSVIDPDFANQRVWDRLMVWGYEDKPNFLNWQRKRLADLAAAAGIQALTDTSQLIGRQVKIVVSVEDNELTDQFGEKKTIQQNKVEEYHSLRSAPSAQTTDEDDLPWSQ